MQYIQKVAKVVVKSLTFNTNSQQSHRVSESSFSASGLHTLIHLAHVWTAGRWTRSSVQYKEKIWVGSSTFSACSIKSGPLWNVSDLCPRSGVIYSVYAVSCFYVILYIMGYMCSIYNIYGIGTVYVNIIRRSCAVLYTLFTVQSYLVYVSAAVCTYSITYITQTCIKANICCHCLAIVNNQTCFLSIFTAAELWEDPVAGGHMGSGRALTLLSRPKGPQLV